MAIAEKGRAVRGVEAVAERPDGTRVRFIPFPTPLCEAEGRVVGAINMLVDVSERKQAETQQRILLNELNHRVKNNMQMLQSLLYSSARQAQNVEARNVLAEASGRIAAMAAAQRVLYGTTGARPSGRPAVVPSATAQQTLPPNVAIGRGRPGEITNDTTVPLALILNELYQCGEAGSAPRKQHDPVAPREPDGLVLSVEDDGPSFDLRGARPFVRLASGRRPVTADPRTFRVTRTPPAGVRYVSRGRFVIRKISRSSGGLSGIPLLRATDHGSCSPATMRRPAPTSGRRNPSASSWSRTISSSPCRWNRRSPKPASRLPALPRAARRRSSSR
jgi:hypothetical protein